MQGERPYPEKAKRPTARPAIRTPPCSPCSSENGPRSLPRRRHHHAYPVGMLDQTILPPGFKAWLLGGPKVDEFNVARERDKGRKIAGLRYLLDTRLFPGPAGSGLNRLLRFPTKELMGGLIMKETGQDVAHARAKRTTEETDWDCPGASRRRSEVHLVRHYGGRLDK